MVWVPEDLGLIAPQGWAPWPLGEEPRLRITASVPVDTQTSVNLTLRSNIAGTLWWVLTDSATVPTTTQIAAGQDHTGGAAERAGTATMPPLVENSPQTGLVVADTYHVHGYVDSSDVEVLDTPIASITYFQGVIPAVLGFSITSPPEGYEFQVFGSGSQGNDVVWAAFAGAHTPPTASQVLASSVGDYIGVFSSPSSPAVPVTENDVIFTVYAVTQNSVSLTSPMRSGTQLVSDVVAPVITTWAVNGALTTRNEVTFDFEVDEDGNIYYLATLASAAAPTAATIISTGATEAVVAATPDSFAFTGLNQATSYRFSAVAVDAAGNESLLSADTASTAARAVITAFTVDTAETTDDAITVDVTVDSTGTLFRLATLQSASAPDEATIIAAALSQAVTAATPTTAVYTGLDDDTEYRLSAVFEDADGNTSLISTALETTDEASSIDYSSLTHIVGAQNVDFYNLPASDWGTWLQAGETEPVTIGCVFRRLKQGSGTSLAVARTTTTQGFNLAIGNLSSAPGETRMTAKGGTFTLTTGGNASPRTETHTQIMSATFEDTAAAVRVDKAFSNTAARSDDLPVARPATDNASTLRVGDSDTMALVCFWVCKGVVMTQGQHDTFCDQVKAGTRIWPEQATSAWHVHALSAAPSTIADAIGSGPTLTIAGTPTVATQATPTFNF